MSSTGSDFGAYRLKRPIRDSQAGDAFLAVRRGDRGFEMPVVVRRWRRDRAAQVVEEAKRAAAVAHAGIAHVLDAGVIGSSCFVVSEYALGVSLAHLLDRRTLAGWKRSTQVACAAANALGRMHAIRDGRGALLGVTHRRLAPRRVVIGPSGSVTLTGLGTAWAWPDAQGFASPEEERGEPIDGRADVYALGLILRRCLLGCAYPAELEGILAEATAPLPEDRCTGVELSERLERLLWDRASTRPPAQARPLR